MELVIDILIASWAVLAAMAPYLLLGFFVAGVLSVVIPAEWVERHLGGRGLGQVFKAALVGVPLPLRPSATWTSAPPTKPVRSAARGRTTATNGPSSA